MNFSTIGKYLFALPMLVFGIFHFMNASAFAGAVPEIFPFPVVWVYITGAGFILASVALVLDKKAKLASALLGLMFLTFALTIWLPEFINQGPNAGNFVKDIAMAGAAFFISAHSKN